MLTSNLEELHEFAKRIGLKRSWFQDQTFPHYDLTASKRALALKHGATEINPGEFPNDMLIRRKDGSYRRAGDR